MALLSEKLYQFLKEYKMNKDHNIFLNFLKKLADSKTKISIEITDNYSQMFCDTLSEIINDKNVDYEENTVMDIICDIFLGQVSHPNVRWYLLEKCHILECLAKRFLQTPSTAVQIKISKTIQTYLIYSRIDETSYLITTDLVSEMLKALVTNLRVGSNQDLNEASLGLLASICQIWSGNSQIMNVINDYQTLRKQLLRFLSADTVKRTTIVYTMTIMFHLCNSDDRLFNKRNIRQTLQVLFNIMLNGENSWASLYSAALLTEVCKSNRTSHLLEEYTSLPVSLKDTLSQIPTKEKIVVEKYLEFVLTISSLNAEYRHLVMEKVAGIDHTSSQQMIGAHYDIPIWTPSQSESNKENILAMIIQLLLNSEINISVCAAKILDDVYMELYSSKSFDGKLPHLSQLSETIYQFLSTMSGYLINSKLPINEQQSMDLESYFWQQNATVVFSRAKVIIQLTTNLLITGDFWLDRVPQFVSESDRIIRDLLESSPLIKQSVQQVRQSLTMVSLSVEIFIDFLYFYYRATELRPNSNLFGERLKLHLEHSKCPIMLAFALSVAINSQSTLQRALVLQGVCLHLQEFNVELMGEKMYLFSNEFSDRKLENKQDTLKPFSKNINGPNTFSTVKSVQTLCSESVDGDHLNDLGLHMPGSEILKINSEERASHTELTNQNNTINDIKVSDNKDDLLTKVQEIIRRFTDKPETNFSASEIYSLFEYRIQTMQKQETLMEEMVSNKTTALHQSEALLTQYRNKLLAIEKENRQLRNMQSDNESKIDQLAHKVKQQADKIVELERINQTLIDTNRMNEVQKEEAQSMFKKMQDRFSKYSEERSQMEKIIKEYSQKLEDANKLMSFKDNQISSYSHITKLINKLTGNKQPIDNTLDQHLAEITKSINTPPPAAFDKLMYPVRSTVSTNQSNSTTESVNSTIHSQKFCTDENSKNINLDNINKDRNNSQTVVSPIFSKGNDTTESTVNHKSLTSTVTASDFLHLYKSNCHLRQNQKEC